MPTHAVFSYNEMPWQDLRELPGARGFKYKALVCSLANARCVPIGHIGPVRGIGLHCQPNSVVGRVAFFCK
jgi:hypothetical protein